MIDTSCFCIRERGRKGEKKNMSTIHNCELNLVCWFRCTGKNALGLLDMHREMKCLLQGEGKLSIKSSVNLEI